MARNERRAEDLEPIAAVDAVQDASDYAPAAVAGRVVRALGDSAVADLLVVPHNMPSLWAEGEPVTEEARMRLADLDALLGHMLATFTPAQAALWLQGQEPHLHGARPVDVFRTDGSAPLVVALKAVQQGTYSW